MSAEFLPSMLSDKNLGYIKEALIYAVSVFETY